MHIECNKTVQGSGYIPWDPLISLWTAWGPCLLTFVLLLRVFLKMTSPCSCSPCLLKRSPLPKSQPSTSWRRATSSLRKWPLVWLTRSLWKCPWSCGTRVLWTCWTCGLWAGRCSSWPWYTSPSELPFLQRKPERFIFFGVSGFIGRSILTIPWRAEEILSSMKILAE